MTNPDLAISLGPNCKNTWNLRNFFSFDRAYPFDWWITPAKSMLNLLGRGETFQVERGDLFLTPENNGENSVYNAKYNVLHHHDFDRQNGLVGQLTDHGVALLNEKYQYLFSRFWADISEASRPLFVLNGIYAGWGEGRRVEGRNRVLNGSVSPANLIEAVREIIGEKARVLIIEFGDEEREDFTGGCYLRLPDLGARESLPPGQSFAEPVHVFREAFRRLGFQPSNIYLRETAQTDRIRISNNTPGVRYD